MNTMLLPLAFREAQESDKKTNLVKKGYRILRSIVSRGFLVLFGLLLSGAAYAQSADLLVNLIHTPNPMPVGGVVTYTITVENRGPDAATAVQLVTTLPPNSIFESVNAPAGMNCSHAGGTVTCTQANFPFSGQAVITLQARLPEGFGNDWSNCATISSTTPDPRSDNDERCVRVTTYANADLALTATTTGGAGLDPLNPLRTGEQYSYTLTVRNTGPDALPADETTTVEFEVPEGAMVRSAPTGAGWTCAPKPPAPYPRPSLSIIECTRSDGLAVNASFPTITVPAVVSGEVSGGAITGSFSVISTFLDKDAANNTDDVTVYVSPVPNSDVSITKTRAPATGDIAVGSNVTYTLTPRFNAGVNPTNVTVTDTLVAGLTYVSHSTTPAVSPWVCDFGTTTPNTLTCVYPGEYTGGLYTNLPTITLVATVNATGTINNTANIEADQDDPIPGNNSSTIGVTGSNNAQLTITKTSSATHVYLNDPYTFTVTVRNTGPQPIPAGQTVVVTETIPASMTLGNTFAPAPWVCEVGGVAIALPLVGLATMTCTYTVPAGSPVAVNTNLPVLTLPVTNTAIGALENQACVEARTNPDSTQQCATRRVYGTLEGQGANLSISKSATPDTVAVGDLVTYTLTITNGGPGTAHNVVVSDRLENLLTTNGFVSATTTHGTCGVALVSSVLTCNLGDLANGVTATVTITIRPANTTAVDRTHTNVATVTSDTVDPVPGNNTSSTTSTIVQPRVDVTVTKTVTPNPVREGEPMAYVVTARNNGPSTARSVETTDPIPPGTAFVSGGSVTGGGSCVWPAAGATGVTITCTWTTIAPGIQQTATFRLRPLPGTEGQTLTNTVTISTDSTETDTTNNTGTASTTVQEPRLDILVTKQSNVVSVNVGSPVTYTIRIENLGPSYGTNLVMTDDFPRGTDPSAIFTYEGSLTVVPAGGTCAEPTIGDASGPLVCTFPTIAPGEVIEVRYDMQARSIINPPNATTGTYTNDVTVSVDEVASETNWNNNEDSQTVTVALAPLATDLSIAKDVDRRSVRTGEQVDYTFVVTNHGPLDVREVNGASVTDPLPTGLTFITSPDGCSLIGGTNTVFCPVGNLDVGDSKTFRIRASIAANAGTLPNVATVTLVGDTNPNNNTSNTSITVLANPSGFTAIPILNIYGLLALLAAVVGIGAAYRRKYR